MSTRRPLTSRPSDLIYFVFFLTHIPATLLVDCQALYPARYVPEIIRSIPTWYVAVSGDPLIGGAMGIHESGTKYAWFTTFLWLEAMFQLPVFFLGARALYNDSHQIYTLLLLYGASTATTTLACLGVLFATPTTSSVTIAEGLVSIAPTQRAMLLSSYLPYFLLPLWMAIDMAFRVQALIAKNVHAERALRRSKEQ
ncbi:transmembrane protein 6/97 [Amylostereum chailletii]|nr:transmembrane protein 6/97 [Amylostereum chailletii]